MGDVTDEILTLSQDLIDTCVAQKGLGLAATQIGVDRRVFVLDVGRASGKTSQFVTFVDPIITPDPNAQTAEIEEGCLSVPNTGVSVKRALAINVEFTSLTGSRESHKADGTFAIAMQHEVDHLDGITIADKAPKVKRSIIRQKMVKLKKAIERGKVVMVPTDSGLRI